LPRTMALAQDGPIATPGTSTEEWAPYPMMPYDMMMPMPPLGWNWHAGMPQATPHPDLPHDVIVDALQSFVNSTREQVEAKKCQLERVGYQWLLEENPPKVSAAAPPMEPPGDFPDQVSAPPAPPQEWPSVETPVKAANHGVQSSGDEEAEADLVLPLKRAATTGATMIGKVQGSETQAEVDLPLKRAVTTGASWTSKVQTSELHGKTLAVFSVHENHIVNSSSRQWVSDPFFVKIQDVPVEFRVQFIAKQMAEGKKGHSFKKASGCGKMELKCAGEPGEGDRFRVAFLAGPGVKQYSLRAATTDETGVTGEAGDPAKKMVRRLTPSCHDFGKYPIFGLAGDEEMWDFGSLLDKKKQLVHIGVEMLPQSLPQGSVWSQPTAVPGDDDYQNAQFEKSQNKSGKVETGAPKVEIGAPPGLELERDVQS